MDAGRGLETAPLWRHADCSEPVPRSHYPIPAHPEASHVSSVHLLAASVSIFVITAAILDFRSKKIPNWITVPAAIAALLFHIFAPQGIGIGWALAGFA